jgi:hypothetical protein
MFGDNIGILTPVEPNWIAIDIGAICYAVRSIVRYTSSQYEMPNKAGGVTSLNHAEGNFYEWANDSRQR